MKSATEEWTNCERLNLLKAALEHESWDNRCTELTSKCGSDRPGNFFNAKRCKEELDRICAEALPGHIATGRDDVHYTKRFVLERWIEFYKGEDTDRLLEMKNIEMRKNMDLVERLLSKDKRPPPDQIRHLLEIAREKDKNHPNPEKLERMRLAYQKRIAEVLREQKRTGESSVSSGPPVSIPPTRASTVQLPKAFKSPSPLKSPIRSVDEVIAEAEAAMDLGDVQDVVLFEPPAPSQESEMKMDTEEAPEALPPPSSEPSAEEEHKMELEEAPAAEPIAEAEQEKKVEEELARPETLPVTSPSSSKKGRSPGPSISTAAVASPTTPSRRHLRGTVAPQVDSAEIEKKAADIIAAGKAKERAKEQAVVEHVKKETTITTTTTATAAEEEVVVTAAEMTTPTTQQRRGRQQQPSQQRRSTRGKAGETTTTAVVSPPSALPVKTEAADSTTTKPVYTRKKGANERTISTSSSVSAAEKQTVEGAPALESVPKEEKIDPTETPSTVSRRRGGKMRGAAEKSEETAKKAERASGGNRKRTRQEMEEEAVVIEDDDATLRPPTPKVKAQTLPAETPSSGRRVTRRSQGAAAVDKAFEHSATASVASDTSTTAGDSAAFATPTSTVPLRQRRKTSSDAASEGRRTPSLELDITPTTSMAAPSRKRMRFGGRGEPLTTTISPLGAVAIPVATPPVADATPTLPASTTSPLPASDSSAPVAQESIALCDVETETEIVIKTAEKEKQTTEKSPRRGSNRIEKEAPSTATKPAAAAPVVRYRSSDRDAPATRDAGIQTNKKVEFAPSDEVHITFDANEDIFHPTYDLENEKKSRVKPLPLRDDDEKTRRRGTAKQSESEAEEDTVVSPARATRNEGKHEITIVINADKDTIDYWVAASGQQQSAAAGSSTPAAAAAAASPSSHAAMTPPTGKKGSRKGAAEEGGASRRKSMQAIKGEDMAMKNSLLSVMRDVFSHRHSSVFSYPVNDRDAPGYSAAVKNPVHLWKIRQDIDNGIIRSGITTRHRIVHMFMNAVMFNSSGHDVNTFAQEMYRETMLVKEPEVRRTKSTFMSAPKKPFVDEASLSFSRPPSEVPEKEMKREVESDGETQREREARPVRKVFKRTGVNNIKKRAAT